MGIHSHSVFVEICFDLLRFLWCLPYLSGTGGMFKYSVGKIWVAPVVIGILGGRVPGVLQWIEESLGNIAFPVVGLP